MLYIITLWSRLKAVCINWKLPKFLILNYEHWYANEQTELDVCYTMFLTFAEKNAEIVTQIPFF